MKLLLNRLDLIAHPSPKEPNPFKCCCLRGEVQSEVRKFTGEIDHDIKENTRVMASPPWRLPEIFPILSNYHVFTTSLDLDRLNVICRAKPKPTDVWKCLLRKEVTEKRAWSFSLQKWWDTVLPVRNQISPKIQRNSLRWSLMTGRSQIYYCTLWNSQEKTSEATKSFPNRFNIASLWSAC